MGSVIVRFVATLVGSLAAFYLAAHGLYAFDSINAETLASVDAMFALLFRPVTSIDAGLLKTTLAICGALVAQGLLLAALFRRWDGRPKATAIRIERVEREIPERLMETELAEEEEAHAAVAGGPSARAIEAALLLAARRGPGNGR
jgi:hypothetical protein